MRFLSARRAVSACALSAAAVAALVAPGASTASLGAQCSGANIGGQGSSLQKLAQELWNPAFNTSAEKHACNGTQGTKATPTISYNPSGSGTGLKSWGVGKVEHKFEATNAFIGTDEAPNPTALAEIEENETTITPQAVATIPVLQAAVAVIVHLPEGCMATSTSNAGRLVLNNGTLEKIWRNEISKWSQITDNGDKLMPFSMKVANVTETSGSAIVTVASGGFPEVVVGMKVNGSGIPSGTTVSAISGNELTLSKAATASALVTLTFVSPACHAETSIAHVVRQDGSGTTHIFKKYLALVNSASFEATNNKSEAVGSRTWNEIAEGPENTTWPTADAVIRPVNKGGTELVAKVAATPSSIGYANLADARANTAFIPSPGGTGGVFRATFWVPIQNNEGETVTYADPASNKEVDAPKESNCGSEEYTNGVVAFPPESVRESWSAVTTKTTEPHYTICGLTFDLALIKYGAFGGTSLAEATTVNNYMQFVVNGTKEVEGNKQNGGQTLIKLHDYEPLTGTVLKEAQKGAALVGF
jgi:ABC-type phosphate transport system substrate-binding protein